MRLTPNFYTALISEFQKLAVISPAGQLFSASRLGANTPVNFTQKAPIPSLGNLGKLPPISQTTTGLNVGSKMRTNGQVPNAPSVPSMNPVKRSL